MRLGEVFGSQWGRAHGEAETLLTPFLEAQQPHSSRLPGLPPSCRAGACACCSCCTPLGSMLLTLWCCAHPRGARHSRSNSWQWKGGKADSCCRTQGSARGRTASERGEEALQWRQDRQGLCGGIDRKLWRRAGEKRTRVSWEQWLVRGWTQRESDPFWSRKQGMPTECFRIPGAPKSICKLFVTEICPFLGGGRDIYCSTTCSRDLAYGWSCCSSNDKWGGFLSEVHSFLSM